MSKAVIALWASLISTAGALFMAGWAAHAEMGAVFAGSIFVGIAGIACLGFMAWVFYFD